jgi:hypothetical protein
MRVMDRESVEELFACAITMMKECVADLPVTWAASTPLALPPALG